MKVLIVEDDDKLAGVLLRGPREQQSDTTRARDFAEGLSTISFVLLDPADPRTIQGSYSLSSIRVEFDAVPPTVATKWRVAKHRTMSATVLGRLAVSTVMQGRRLGETLLCDALTRASLAAQQVGSALIVVHALDEDAERFHGTHGFVPFANVTRGWFLPTAKWRR